MEDYKDFLVIEINLHNYGKFKYFERYSIYSENIMSYMSFDFYKLRIEIFTTLSEKYSNSFIKDYSNHIITYFDYYNNRYSKLTKTKFLI